MKMGCDIHIYVEYKVGKGKWTSHEKHVEDEDGYIRDVDAVGRSYELFGLLANVRSLHREANMQPKGFPKNASAKVREAKRHWGEDGHSHSYMTLKQFEKVLNTYNKNNEYEIPPTDRTDMFFTHDYNYNEYPPSFSTIVSSCKRHAEELQADYILLGEKPPEIKHRLVFWFDN